MMFKCPKVAMAIALVAPLSIAAAGNSKAAPMLSDTGALKASSSLALTEVQYYYGPYGYYPAYQYRGYTYWYPGYWGPSGYYYYHW
jgi:hypothetical protein